MEFARAIRRAAGTLSREIHNRNFGSLGENPLLVEYLNIGVSMKI